MILRRYENNDIDKLITLWELSTRYAHPFLSQEEIERQKKEIVEVFIHRVKTCVAEKNGEIFGFICMLENNVVGLFVNPSHHRLGIGTKLIELMKEEYGKLEVDVYKKNTQGISFYSKMGFKYYSEFMDKHTVELIHHLVMV